MKTAMQEHPLLMRSSLIIHGKRREGEERGAMAWRSRPSSNSMGTEANTKRPVFDMGELQSQLRSADLHGAMQILQSLLNDKQLDAATKEAVVVLARQSVREGCSSPEAAFDKDGWTPLYRATYSGYTEIVRLLLEARVDVNATTLDGRAPLHHASHAGDVDIVRLLLQDQADLNITDKDGRTPIHIASSTGRTEVVRLLVQAQADVQPRNAAGMTPLHRAKTPAIARYLLEGGASPNAVNQIGWNPLHAACARLRHGVASVLTLSTSELNTADHSGYLPIHLALLYVWFTGSSAEALKTLQVLVTSGSVWDATCDAIADQAEQWPSCWIRRGLGDQCWQREAPAIRVCVERWIQEHKQGLPLTEVPVEQVRNGLEDTQIFIQALAESREVKFRRKICVVGPSNWGKTSLVKSLATQKPSLVHPDDRTIGIDHFILTFEEQIADFNATKKHEVTFWDFAGQDSYQTAHSLFFSARTLYIVVIDLESYVTAKMQAELMTDTESETDRWMNEFIETRVLQWIRLICARQGDAEFVFVATKKDCVVNADLDDRERENGDDGVLRDLRKRLEKVAVVIDAMKSELDKKRSVRHQPAMGRNATEPLATLPITHLGDERLGRMSTKPSVHIIVTSCVSFSSDSNRSVNVSQSCSAASSSAEWPCSASKCSVGWCVSWSLPTISRHAYNSFSLYMIQSGPTSRVKNGE